jgi:methyltransferase-like protein 6
MVIAQTYNGIISYCFGHLLSNSSFFILGLYDMTMLRFLAHQRVGFREYMRSDGTLSYFFTLDTVRELFHAAGLIELELEYCCVKSVNRKNGKKMQRVWVHGKFLKPPS